MKRYELFPRAIVKNKTSGKLYRVDKVGTKYAQVTDEDGNRWKVSFSALVNKEPHETFALKVPEATGLVLGSLVRYNCESDLSVVVSKRGTTYGIAKLGGDGGKWRTNVSGVDLEEVTFNVDGV